MKIGALTSKYSEKIIYLIEITSSTSVQNAILSCPSPMVYFPLLTPSCVSNSSCNKYHVNLQHTTATTKQNDTILISQRQTEALRVIQLSHNRKLNVS